MSDGKSSSYTVVSAEELKRRALAAANSRLDRANEAIAALLAELAAAEMTYGSLGVSAPAAEYSSSTEPTDVDGLAARLESAVAAGRGRVQSAVSAARSEHFAALAQELSAALKPTQELTELKVTRPGAQPAVKPQVESALRVLARLPGDARPEAVSRGEKLVAGIQRAESTTRADTLLTALRESVQVERERADLIDQNRARLAGLLTQLDGVDGDEAAKLRGQLRGAALDAPLPAGLESKVAHAREAAVNAADREFARRVLRDALVEAGYTVGDDFVTVVASGQAVVLPLAASVQHGVRVRESGGRLNFNVVRFTEPDSGVDDLTAAASFCESFAEIERLAAETFGLEMERVGDLAAGSTKLQVLDQVSPFASATSASTKAAADARRRQQQRDQEMERQR
jgi:hypothetical protein